mmetsp:Transcript_4135/g.6104  ORF Transcript_4135/g.6104 Transcript_4135/m.6104 type:complete len:237 (+) Transcript_4135:37-747(+)
MILYLIERVCSIFSIVLFLSPIRDILSLRNAFRLKQRAGNETIYMFEDVNLFPFYTMHITSLFWFSYGIMIGDLTVYIPNGFGYLCTFFYLYSIYIMKQYESSRSRRIYLTTLLCFYVLLFGVIGLISSFTDSFDTFKNYFGMACAFFTICMFASPLARIKEVLFTRNSKLIPLLLSICQAINCFAWTFYGFLVLNYNLMLPNLLGLILTLIALGVKAYVTDWRGHDRYTLLPVTN